MHIDENGALIYDAEESKEKTCPICGYTPLEVIHDEHEGVEFRFDHWVCNCGAEGVMTYKSTYNGQCITTLPEGPAKSRRYKDKEGNLHYISPGCGGSVYKGVRFLSLPECKEQGVEGLRYLKDKNQAQRELDAYAARHHLIEIDFEEKEFNL